MQLDLCVFLEVPFLAFLVLYAEEYMWPDGTHPMLFRESSCVCMLSFRPFAKFFFGKSFIFLGFFMQ